MIYPSYRTIVVEVLPRDLKWWDTILINGELVRLPSCATPEMRKKGLYKEADWLKLQNITTETVKILLEVIVAIE